MWKFNPLAESISIAYYNSDQVLTYHVLADGFNHSIWAELMFRLQ